MMEYELYDGTRRAEDERPQPKEQAPKEENQED